MSKLITGVYDRRLGFLRLLDAVLGPLLPALIDSGGIKFASHDVIAHSRKILYPAAADKHDRMFLQFVPFARDVSGNFHSIGKLDPGHLAQRGIRFFGRGSEYLGADPPFQRRKIIARPVLQ